MRGLEYGLVQLGEKLLVQRADRLGQILLGDNQAQIQQARALADHPDIDPIERAEDAARDSRRVADVLADQADDRLAVLHSDGGKLPQLATDRIQAAGVVDRERHANLRRRDHINRRFVPVEDLEDPAQEAMSHQHAGGLNVDQRDFPLTGDRLHDVAAADRLGDDARAGDFRAARVEDQDRNVLLDRRDHGRGMQHLRAEIGELGGLGERDRLHAVPAGEDGWVGGEHAVDVGPDLDFLGSYARADDRSGVVGSTAAKRSSDTGFSRGDEASHYDD